MIAARDTACSECFRAQAEHPDVPMSDPVPDHEFVHCLDAEDCAKAKAAMQERVREKLRLHREALAKKEASK